MRRTRGWIAGLGLMGMLLEMGCEPGVEIETVPVGAEAEVQFVDMTAAVGLDFHQVSGSPEQRYILESMSSGAAFFDYDGDGYLDLFLVNSTRVEDDSATATNRLYRNAEGPEGRVFQDATDAAGLRRSGWGMGCAVGDYDNDGDVDLYITYWGPNVLYRNDGNKGFTEVELGVADEGWGTSAAFGDVDADGFLDLYVANYLVFDLQSPPGGGQLCSGFKGLDVYCGPHGMVAQANALYRNEGGGSFVDVGQVTGVDADRQASLGVVFGDYDGDGDQDIYVANDGYPNLLYRNDGDWQLAEIAAFAGAAYSEDGRAQAGMGVAAGDYDNDGDLDLYMTHFSDDVNTLYQNQGDGSFIDLTAATGLGGEVRPYLGWSTGFFDYDNDGWLDLFAVNGHIYPQVDQHPSGLHYAQRNLLYRNMGGAFAEVGVMAGLGFAKEKVSRGGALGDYDNDGDLDLLVMNLNDAPTLLHNRGGSRGNWLGLELVGTGSNRDALGARVTLLAGERAQMREVQRGAGYLSQNDGRVLFGLGAVEAVESVEIRWPSGRVQVLERPEIRRYLVVQEDREGIVSSYAGPAETEELAARDQPVETDSRPAASLRYAEEPDQTAADHYRAGIERYRQGRYQEAIDAFRVAIRMRPDDLKAYYSLGIVLYSGLGRSAAAAAVLEEAVDRDSSWSQVYPLLGAVYLDLNRTDTAIQFLERVVALDPDWESHNRLGLARLRSGDLTAAIAAFEQAARQAPWKPHPHLNLARIYKRQGREQAALRERQMFTKLRPIEDNVQRQLENLTAFPGDVESRLLLGEAYLAQGRIEEALSSYHQAIAADDSYAPAHYGLGAAL
ncbi:MAG: FG-GAP-like repeat-containing protein, partial [Candidatus Latescibacterota bacterium]|nr:FG-GAP-like repeat-containing protein [Candidatus Latescibacterota bacterium]